MKLIWEESLKKRLKIYGYIIVIPIILLILVGLLVGSMGLIGDLIAKPRLNEMRKEALTYFEDFRSQGGYQKPVYNGKVEDGNAWDFYARAVKAIEPMTDSERNSIEKFLRGKEVDIEQISLILFRYEGALNDVRRGLKQTRCLLPIEYEKGIEAPLPDYMSLRTLTKLLASHGRLSQNMGRSHQATRDYLDAARFGQDITGGDRTFIGHMIGTVCLSFGITEMKKDLKTFSFPEEDLKEIARDLNLFSSTWPSLGEDILSETWMMPITDIKMEEKMPNFVDAGSITRQFLHNRFFLWGFTHLRSWSTFFSVNRAWVDAITSYQEHAKGIAKIEDQNLQKLKQLEEQWDERISESHNWVEKMAVPYSFSMTKRRLEAKLKIRLRGAAALAQLYHLQNHSYPSNLIEVDAREMGELLKDPMTGQSWKYKVFANGDSAQIYSPYNEEKPNIATITLGPPPENRS
ncbi:hypothetical protein IIA15_04805 [candidate division TA06 bacterium]|nr:hypothetical protein [candidate division TA06 bacterium]